jgi:hypothetical protein
MAKVKRYMVLVVAPVSENSIVKNVREAIRREVAMGGEFNTRWIPAEPPMALRAQQWQATGGAIVDALRGIYPNLVVKRQEVGAHFKKELTVFRKFLTDRLKKK